MKGGVVNDDIRNNNKYGKSIFFIYRVYCNAYRILSQRHSLVNAVG